MLTLPRLARASRRVRARIGNSAWRALRHAEFRVYFVGSLASNLGTWIQNTAQVLLAYQLTRSVLGVGVVTAAQYAGSLVLGPWAAVVADRIGGKRTLAGGQVLSAALAAGLAALQSTGLLTEPLLTAGALALGLANTFMLPVQTSLVPRLLPEAESKADTEAAMALNHVSYNAGRAVAPALCIPVIIFVGFTGAFALNAASFLMFAILLRGTRPRPSPKPSRHVRASDSARIALGEPRLWLLLFMIAAVTIADDPVLVLGPARARQLGVSHDWAGYFLSALGGGAVLWSLARLRARSDETISDTSRRAAISLLALGGSMVLFAFSWIPLLTLAAAAFAGAAALATGRAAQALLVRRRPGLEASVMAAWAIAWAGTKPVASLVDGWLASSFGVQCACVVLAAPAITLALMEMLLPDSAKLALKQWAHRKTAQIALARPAGPLAPDSPVLAVGAGATSVFSSTGPWTVFDERAAGSEQGESTTPPMWESIAERSVSIT